MPIGWLVFVCAARVYWVWQPIQLHRIIGAECGHQFCGRDSLNPFLPGVYHQNEMD